jgi:hypothetical protein
MKRILPLYSLLFALCLAPATAILDTNNNGVSDIWERANNDGELFDESFNPQADPDFDGWTSELEAAAGTDPFNPNPPDGFLHPEIVHIPAVSGDPGTPETVTVSWPTIPGKQYTLLYSPDLTEWLPVPDETFIGSGSIVTYSFLVTESDTRFWRVGVTDADSDGDGLTDAEENQLGTNPDNSETISGFPDSWIAKYFSDILLNGGPLAFDPNADPDGDELTNAQEYLLDTDPGVADNPGISQESITNGDFSAPILGTGLSGDTTWDYWAEVPGWHAVVGQNIEYQNIEPIAPGNQYAELKGDPEDHYGIKQKVGTRIGANYLIVFDCKDRADVPTGSSNFDVKVDGATILSITFATHGTWTTRVVAFKATKVIAEISMVPVLDPNSTTGCLVDNIRIAPVAIEDDIFASGVDNVSVMSNDSNLRGYKDKFWIMAPCGGQAYNDAMRFTIPLVPAADLNIESVNATPSPDTISLSPNTPAPVVTWRGNGADSIDNSPVWKIGPAAVTVELPIRVKSMKKRTVKVAIFPARDPQNARAVVPMPPVALLQSKLDETLGYQLNAWCIVEYKPQQPYDYDPDGDGYAVATSQEFAQMADSQAFSAPDTDIRVFVIDGVHFRSNPAAVPGTIDLEIYGRSQLDQSLVIVNAGNPTEGIYLNQAMVDTLAHEIGHLMVGEGHPSDYNIELALGGSHGGPAPLPGTDTALRLMSGHDARAPGARLLVKAEWDLAEEWLKSNSDARYTREHHLNPEEPTGNY